MKWAKAPVWVGTGQDSSSVGFPVTEGAAEVDVAAGATVVAVAEQSVVGKEVGP